MVSKHKPHKLRQLIVQQVKPAGCNDKGTAVVFLLASVCWARRLYIWSREHLATLHIQKDLSQSPVSPRGRHCQACSSTPCPPHPEPSHDLLQLDLGALCPLWPASNQKQPQLADSTRSYDIMRQQQTFWDPVAQLFAVGLRARLRILNRNDTDFTAIVNTGTQHWLLPLYYLHLIGFHWIWRNVEAFLRCTSPHITVYSKHVQSWNL